MKGCWFDRIVYTERQQSVRSGRESPAQACKAGKKDYSPPILDRKDPYGLTVDEAVNDDNSVVTAMDKLQLLRDDNVLIKDNEPTEDVKTCFDRLPLPGVPQDFKLPHSLRAAVKRLQNRPSPYVHIRRSILWKGTKLKLAIKDTEPTEDVKTGFERLPLPGVSQDFKLPHSLRLAVKRLKDRPSPYVHIRRNIYLVKKPRRRPEDESMQCSCQQSSGSSDVCDKDCLCGMLLTSCSSSCKCGDSCSNLPFQKRRGRKMKAVKTERCGWGLKADEDIKAGDFLVEYVGEVIDDETCEKRLWAMKEQGESNFYMCEITREMVIDATFKGNLSRFINHSCTPNCELQKWQIEGEIRIGVFSTVEIKKGEFINYDYKFIQFGTNQLCHCGSASCRGQLGKPQKQKACADNSVSAISSDLILSRSLKRSKLLSARLSLEHGYPPIGEVLHHRKTPIVVQADLHYRRRGGENCVGLRVKVWWPLDQKFYHGKIVRYDATIGKHQIMYDDGEEEDLQMNKERWEVERSSPLHRKGGKSRMICKRYLSTRKRFSQRIKTQLDGIMNARLDSLPRLARMTRAARKTNLGSSECYGMRKRLFRSFGRFGDSH